MDPSRLTDAITAAAQTLAVDQVTAECVTAFRAAGLEPVLLKGPTFAGWLYPSDTLRPYVDTDLLVAPEQQTAAAEVLVGLGFDDPMADALLHERDDHSRTFYRPAAGARRDEVDLHFTLAGARADSRTVWSVLSTETERMDVAGVPVTALNQPGRALHAALHAAQDGRSTDQPVRDLERAVDVAPVSVWRRAAALAAEMDAMPAMAAGLERSPAGVALLSELGVSAAEAGTYERLRRGTPPPMALGVARLLEARDRRGLARELFREVVPSPAFMRLWSPLARRGRLGLVLAYLWRPVSLFVRLGPAVTAYLRARRGSPG